MDEQHILARLNLLRIEHRDLDSAVAALSDGGVPDQLQLARLKKRKLKLRDEISQLEDYLMPDSIA
ncbi:YdcH family protein [Sphingomonas sp.]|uniref:YdcH family protein n=1 Tax=Sphingomonas sp. TaxID=28214 RepID=UPI0035C87123